MSENLEPPGSKVSGGLQGKRVSDKLEPPREKVSENVGASRAKGVRKLVVFGGPRERGLMSFSFGFGGTSSCESPQAAAENTCLTPQAFWLCFCNCAPIFKSRRFSSKRKMINSSVRF